jgi:tetratricopeptide (TPR) repeat protein
MSVRCVILASVCTVCLAASAAVSGAAFALEANANVTQAEIAYRALSAGDQDVAIANYTVAIESENLAPDALANALLNRGLAHQQLGETAEAIDDYTAALRLDAMTAKLRATALYNRGLAQQKLRHQSAAVEDFTGALFLDPQFAVAYYGRGNALRESGQFLFALSDYEKALRFAYPEPAKVHFAQALAYESLKRPDEMRDALARSIRTNPGFAPAAKKMAELGPRGPAIAMPDPVLSAQAPIGGNLTVRKPDLPKAIAPPAELASAAVEPTETATAAPTFRKFQDRIPVETAAMEPQKAVPAQSQASAPAAEPAAETASIEPVESAPEPAAAQPDSGSIVPKGWSVQVASASSEAAAWSTWKKIQAKRKVTPATAPVLMRADLGAKGVFYRVRFTGYENQREAKSACSKLKAKGVACYASKIN